MGKWSGRGEGMGRCKGRGEEMGKREMGISTRTRNHYVIQMIQLLTDA